MTTELTTNDLIIVEPLPLDQHPAAVYVAGLARGSRRTMRAALDKIADWLIAEANALTINWAALRFQHTAAIRSRLAELYSAATANKMLSALRGVLKVAWRLGQVSSDDYQRAADIDRIEGSTLPAAAILILADIPPHPTPQTTRHLRPSPWRPAVPPLRGHGKGEGMVRPLSLSGRGLG